jgi:two-component system OmpR family response regulator
LRILFFEHDRGIRESVVRLLNRAGHVVDACSHGPDAIVLGTKNVYSVLVLDRPVAGIDGLRVLKSLRTTGVKTPAMLLTAINDVEDRVEGLQAGADDYLGKPFAETELLARLRTHWS